MGERREPYPHPCRHLECGAIRLQRAAAPDPKEQKLADTHAASGHADTHAERQRRWRKAHPERHAEQQRAHRAREKTEEQAR